MVADSGALRDDLARVMGERLLRLASARGEAGPG
jgi:hypothetical protein